MTARRWQRPRVFAIVLTLLGIALFARLGLWQLDRAVQKEHLLAAFASTAQAPLEKFDSVRDQMDLLHYPHVHISGRFLAGRGYLLDEQMQAGRLGVHAIAVFALPAEDRLLLVDRGWVGWNHVPGTTPAVPALPSDETELSGIYAPYPGGGLRIGGDALPAQTTWPKLTLYLDPAAISSDLGKPVLPGILLLDPAADSGFVRAWTPNVMPPERHRAYALQWFALALAALVIFIVLHWRKVEK